MITDYPISQLKVNLFIGSGHGHLKCVIDGYEVWMLFGNNPRHIEPICNVIMKDGKLLAAMKLERGDNLKLAARQRIALLEARGQDIEVDYN